MSGYSFQQTHIDGLTLVNPVFIQDQRGYLTKPFEAELFACHGIPFTVKEELESRSCRNTLRGLHFQYQHSQDKLVRVPFGEIYDVAVDLRPQSATYGKWQSFYLSSENRQLLYIPKYFAHGFLVLSKEAVVRYLCGDSYDPKSENGIFWNDKDLAIDWPIKMDTPPLLSQRDQSFQSFSEFCQSIGR